MPLLTFGRDNIATGVGYMCKPAWPLSLQAVRYTSVLALQHVVFPAFLHVRPSSYMRGRVFMNPAECAIMHASWL